jgi:hypothetical protein
MINQDIFKNCKSLELVLKAYVSVSHSVYLLASNKTESRIVNFFIHIFDLFFSLNNNCVLMHLT